MNEECPNCRQVTNTSFSRLVKDTCGHTKCRMCLLYEEQGCTTCNGEHSLQIIGNYECFLDGKLPQNNGPAHNKEIVNEEVVLPLELVINKESKPKESNFDPDFIECINDAEVQHNNAPLDDNEKQHEPLIANITANDSSNKLYIPKVEFSNVVSNIQTHLNDTDNPITNNQSQNDLTNDINEPVTVSDSSDKDSVIENNQTKCPDRTHITVIPGTPERYKCNICTKVFRNKKGKCYHDACITGIKPYHCTYCGRTFVKRSHYEYHERVHRGYRPFKCNLCEKAFPQQNKLNRHMISHSKDKPFICPKCGRKYTKQGDFKNHVHMHDNATTYSCRICDKTFRILTNLKRHMRTHINERPYVCEQCNKSFKDKSLLLRHKRTHGKDRPFSCADCNRVFLSKSELKRHVTIHSDEKPFSCKYCQTVFRRKDNLNRHIRHHHSDDLIFNSAKPKNVSDTNTKQAKTKQSNPKQKQKPKRPQRMCASSVPKSPAKVSVINSRLDSMGNITPVIRTTNELSNAVPVINGPISIKRPEEKTDTRKKTFTYTEPIPLAEAVVINRRIEEKLYTQSVSNRNYFFRGCSTCNDKTYPTVTSQSLRTNSFNASFLNTKNTMNKVNSQDNASSDTEKSGKDSALDREESTKRSKEQEKNASLMDKSMKNKRQLPQINYVSTIKKNTVQHTDSSKQVNNHFEVVNTLVSMKSENANEKKQSNVHWRRRMTDTLKPGNQ